MSCCTALIAAFLAATSIQAPPARYDHPPKIQMKVMEAPPSQLRRVCRLASGYRGGGTILACSMPGKSRCIIIWPAGEKRAGLLWRHERAHCNGWPAHHPR